jgi:hypothetical protein
MESVKYSISKAEDPFDEVNMIIIRVTLCTSFFPLLV